ncbi:hypothetical protein IAR55_001021 [Kwoniella newhampshirensis]|uniref:Uncharacterized protein n=1 Tax=Kwoniella newhampshirensis TaxID=1651941 RepID=A0AAW0Z4H5_9TREE
MIETTVGHLSSQRVDIPSLSADRYTSPFNTNSPLPASRSGGKPSKTASKDRKGRLKGDRMKLINDRRENLDSDADQEGVDNADDMAELSDSPSTTHTSSRPVTPSHPPTPQVSVTRPDTKNIGIPFDSTPRSEEIFSLAHKAEKILGLVPGSLAHAKACLENAREEIRRNAVDEPIGVNHSAFLACGQLGTGDWQNGSSYALGRGGGNGNGGGTQAKGNLGKMGTRARKAMSVVGVASSSLGGGSGAKMPNVVLGAGGKDEEAQRERRRKATDGVLYWQREVGRLEAEEHERMRRV